VSIIRRSDNEHVLLCAAHHIAIDYWSFVLLIDEMRQLYRSYRFGKASSLPSVEAQYSDFARWQQDMVTGPAGERLWSYWANRWAGDLPRLNLPLDRPRPGIQLFRGATHTVALEPGLIEDLRSCARMRRKTLYTLVLTAFEVLLHRYTGQNEIVIGSPMAGPRSSEFERTIGYFANTVVLRIVISNNPRFAELLEQVSATAVEAADHQEYPFPLLVERLKVERDPSRAPICDVLFSWDKPQYQD